MRSAEFDKEKVLRAAIGAFIAKGYTKTSMQDLKAATGLHPGSIYCAFESKRGLMLAAIEQYNKDKTEQCSEFFEGNEHVVDGILNYLKHTVQDITSPCTGSHKACLTQKALSEVGDNEPEIEAAIKQSMQAWQDGFLELFKQAQANGELSGTRTPQQRTQALVMGIFGLRTYAQTGVTDNVLDELAQQLFDDVCR